MVEKGLQKPGVQAQQLAEALADLVVGLEVPALAAHMPASMQRRQQQLPLQVFEDARDAGAEVIVDQDGAGIEVPQPDPVAAPEQRLQSECAPIRQRQRRGLGDVRVKGAYPYLQTSVAQDALQLRHVLQVEAIAGVVFRHQQQPAGLRRSPLQRQACGLRRRRQHLGREVVPAAGIQVGVHGRELEARVADVHRAVEDRGVLRPLQAEPALDRRRRVQNVLTKFRGGAVQRREEMGNHDDNLCGSRSRGCPRTPRSPAQAEATRRCAQR